MMANVRSMAKRVLLCAKYENVGFFDCAAVRQRNRTLQNEGCGTRKTSALLPLA